MSKWSDTALTINEAILIAEYHEDVDTVDEAYARTSRANTRDEPTPKPDGWDA